MPACWIKAEMGTDVLPNIGCAAIGLAEVENDHVMNDLISQPELAKRGYKYVHMVERLEDFDDVQNVYTNMKPEEA